jgi:hypothetical protein
VVTGGGDDDVTGRAKHYARFHQGRSSDADLEAGAAMAWVAEAAEDRPELAWAVIVAAIEMTDDERALASIASTDLEVLINLHGRTFIDRIETQHEDSDRFRRALRSVELRDPIIAARIKQLPD